MIRFIVAFAAVLFATAPAHADVVSSAPNGFVSQHTVTVPLAPDAAYDRFVRVGTWWDGAHSYSGKASNMSMQARPGGMWIERLGGGDFVEHMRVVYAQRGKMLRLHGGLGPIQEMGVHGSMQITFAAEGAGTKVTARYAIGGYFPDGTAQMAPGVDFVLGEALKRFAQTSPPK